MSYQHLVAGAATHDLGLIFRRAFGLTLLVGVVLGLFYYAFHRR